MGRGLARIADFQFAHGADEHREHRLGNIVLQAKKPQRRTALAGRTEGRRDDVVDHLLGQSGGVDDHGIDAAGFGDQRHDRSVLGGERAIDRTPDLGRAREADAGSTRIGDEACADFAVAGQQVKRGRRYAGLMQKRHRARGNERGLLGGLRHHRIAGRKRRCDLAEKDRQRKIPRADANKHAAPAIAQHIAFAGGAGEGLHGEPPTRLRCIISAVIDCLAHLGKRVVERLAALILQERQEFAAVVFEQLCGALERFARAARRASPPRRESPPPRPPSLCARSLRPPPGPCRRCGR